MENSVNLLTQELEKVKSDSEHFDSKLKMYADSKFNPLVDQFYNCQKVNETIVQEFNR